MIIWSQVPVRPLLHVEDEDALCSFRVMLKLCQPCDFSSKPSATSARRTKKPSGRVESEWSHFNLAIGKREETRKKHINKGT
jgi:hypothetical protein